MRVNWFLIPGCVLASLYAWQQDPNWADQNLVFSLNNLLAGRVWTLVTALFVHASVAHLLGNMPFLFVFGNTLEKMIGRDNHLLVFFIGGFTSFLLPPLLGIYSPDTGMLGASAAIFTIEIQLALSCTTGTRGYHLLHPQRNNSHRPVHPRPGTLRSKRRLHCPRHRIHSRNPLRHRLEPEMEEEPPDNFRTLRPLPHNPLRLSQYLWVSSTLRRVLGELPL